MNDISDIIKMLAKEAVEGDKPVSVVTGRVTDTDKLTIETEQKLLLTEEFLIITSRFYPAVFKLDTKLLLLRCDGGQKYVILDTIPEIKEEEEEE